MSPYIDVWRPVKENRKMQVAKIMEMKGNDD